MKIAWIGPVSLVLLVNARVSERRMRRCQMSEVELINLSEESVPSSIRR